jgi:hypothetical protein
MRAILVSRPRAPRGIRSVSLDTESALPVIMAKPFKMALRPVCVAEQCIHPAEASSLKVYGSNLCAMHIEFIERHEGRLLAGHAEEVICDRHRRGGVKTDFD